MSRSDLSSSDSRREDFAPLADGDRDGQFEDAILPLVSRTFALTIPQLPGDLREAVTNAYLLCRIADTVEDEPTLNAQQKNQLQNLLVEALDDPARGRQFASEIAPLLSDHTLAAERTLAANAERVLRRTRALPAEQFGPLRRCLRIMCEGMGRFQRSKSSAGLATLADVREYCYVVAGVVGEMLTELFCAHSTAISARRQQLMPRAVSFGRGLQLTNILKDIWEDRAAETCWLPREVFAAKGFDLSALQPGASGGPFEAGLREMIAVAHGYLREAVIYTQAIPKDEVGIRRFCLWSIGLAVLTLRKIHRRPDFSAANQVKVSRRAVRATILTSNIGAGSNRVIGRVFNWFARELPLREVADERGEPIAVSN